MLPRKPESALLWGGSGVLHPG